MSDPHESITDCDWCGLALIRGLDDITELRDEAVRDLFDDLHEGHGWVHRSCNASAEAQLERERMKR